MGHATAVEMMPTARSGRCRRARERGRPLRRATGRSTREPPRACRSPSRSPRTSERLARACCRRPRSSPARRGPPAPRAASSRRGPAATSRRGPRPRRSRRPSPTITRGASRWRRNATPMSAVNSGVAALSSEVKPAGRVTVAIAMSVNGTAENVAPVTRNASTGRAPRRTCDDRTHARTDAPTPAAPRRPTTGPTSRAAIRRNRNAAPQTAPRNRSEARSTGVRLRD